VAKAQEILLELIILFQAHMTAIGTPYSRDYFSNFPARAEIQAMFDLAKPKLTDNFVI